MAADAMVYECCSSDSSDDNVEQIPGFYYDKTKKKYFKLQSHALNPTSSFTSDAMKKQKAEKKARKLIRRIEAESKRRKLLHLCSSLQLSGNDNFLQSNIQRLRLNKWTPKPLSCEFTSEPMRSLITTNGYTFHLTSANLHIGHLNSYIPGRESITSLHSVQLKHMNSAVEYHMTECMGDTVVIAYTANPPAPDPPVFHFHLAKLTDGGTFKVRRQKTQLSRRPHIDAMCSSKAHGFVYLSSADTLNVLHTDATSEISSYIMNKNCRCLATNPTNPNIVYSGSLKGELFLKDLRAARPFHLLYRYKETDKHGFADKRTRLCSLLALEDGMTLAASHVTGMKSLLDARMGRPLAFNRETVTQYSCDLSSIKQDESGRYITSSGSDGGFVYIWDARTLKTVKIVDLMRSKERCHCDITSRNGNLCLLTCQRTSYSLYS